MPSGGESETWLNQLQELKRLNQVPKPDSVYTRERQVKKVALLLANGTFVTGCSQLSQRDGLLQKDW